MPAILSPDCLDISKLDPDADGDGKVSPVEKEIYAALKAADVDGSGSISIGELYASITTLVIAKRANKTLGRLAFGLVGALVLCLGAIFLVSLLAGEALKESHVKGSLMTDTSGGLVAVATAQTTTTLWDLPAVETAVLAEMKVRARAGRGRWPIASRWLAEGRARRAHPTRAPKPPKSPPRPARPTPQSVVLYVDLSDKAGVGSWVEATYKIGGVYKASNDFATLVTTSGEELTIRRAAQTGAIKMADGVAYPISDECTGACSAAGSARRLNTDEALEAPVEFDEGGADRRLLRGGGFLATGGSMCLGGGGTGRGGP